MMFLQRFSIPLVVLFIWSPFPLNAQDQSLDPLVKTGKIEITPIVGLQMWSTYTTGFELLDEETGQFQKVDDRLNFQLRRARFGIKGKLYRNLKFNFTASLDLLGRDLLSGTDAGANNGPSPIFRIWHTYLQWQPFEGNEKFNIVAGYFNPQIGRENVNSALKVPSMEKAWSQNYLRIHLAGTGPGRLPGLLIGGVSIQKDHWFGWGYDAAVFTTTYQSPLHISSGIKSSPLVTGRLGLYLGDPEITKFQMGRKVDPFDERKGLSLGIAGAHQGNTDLFESSTTFAIDYLINWGRLHIDGDWSLMSRTGMHDPEAIEEFTVQSQTGYVRGAYTFPFEVRRALEVTVMYMFFDGENAVEDQEMASQVHMFTGAEHSIDVGMNYYFSSNIKLSLHYTFRGADSGDAGDMAEVNNYFHQGGVGAVRRGDWIGFGIVTVF